MSGQLIKKQSNPEIEKRGETKDGLPVIDAADFERQYRTDIRAFGRDKAATFDFRGFVKEERPDYPKGTFYKDAQATNGLLKGEGHPGIHVGTDGIVDYSLMEQNHTMKSPADVGEYDIYVKIPGILQQELGCYCESDSCYSADDFTGSREELEAKQGGEGWIVSRLGLDPKEDTLARQKAVVIHAAVVKHIEKKRPLHEIKNLIYSLEEELRDEDAEKLTQRLLPEETGGGREKTSKSGNEADRLANEKRRQAEIEHLQKQMVENGRREELLKGFTERVRASKNIDELSGYVMEIKREKFFMLGRFSKMLKVAEGLRPDIDPHEVYELRAEWTAGPVDFSNHEYDLSPAEMAVLEKAVELRNDRRGPMERLWRKITGKK